MGSVTLKDLQVFINVTPRGRGGWSGVTEEPSLQLGLVGQAGLSRQKGGKTFSRERREGQTSEVLDSQTNSTDRIL